MFHKYMELKAELLQEIALGIYPEGSLLPSERDLARMYGISRVSVRHTLDCMLKEGFLEKAPNNRNRIKSISPRADVPQLVFIGYRPLAMLPELYRKYYEAFLMKCTLLNCQLHYFDASSGINCCGIELFDAGFFIGNPPQKTDLPFKLRKIIQLDGKNPSACASFFTDNVAGGYSAAEHLKEYGFRRVALILPQDVDQGEYQGFIDRETGFRKGCAEFDLECRRIVAANSTARSVFAALQGETGIAGIEGLFVLSDYLALNCLRALQEMKIRVPEDLSVIGYDGYSFGAYTVPALTTIAQPVNEIVSNALKIAFQENNVHEDCFIKPTLVIRNSTQKKEI